MKVNRTLLFQQSLDPFSRHNKDNSPGSVFCVLCNRDSIQNKLHSQLCECGNFSYFYIYFIINFQMKITTEM
jgi:hypothetical protein